MTRLRLLDLFCGAGGAAMGYHRAGFDVVGVDIKPQPRYPFEFHQGDAMTWPLAGFDAIHASPPCQDHSSIGPRTSGTGWMLPATRARLEGQPAPWVMENVSGAPMRADFLLCGAMFGLRTYRHRRFELDPRVPGLLLLPEHPRHRLAASRDAAARRGEVDGVMVSVTGGRMMGQGGAWEATFAECLDIDWMGEYELSQAIPPAYTEYIGGLLLEHLAARDVS